MVVRGGLSFGEPFYLPFVLAEELWLIMEGTARDFSTAVWNTGPAIARSSKTARLLPGSSLCTLALALELITPLSPSLQ